MKRIGICFKCGEEKEVISHHRSYVKELKDDVVNCCWSCHRKIHHQIRKKGLCPLTVEEVTKRSLVSCDKRTRKTKMISFDTMMPNVGLFEKLRVNKSTGLISISSYFHANNGKKIKYIDI